jgi:hypothetical protein
VDGLIARLRIGRRPVLLAAGTLALGLWLDVASDLPGQVAIGAACWAVLLALLARLAPEARWPFIACLAIATAGELFLSLAWGLYTYRLGNVPLFVPPGHAMLLLLGIQLARVMPPAAANAVLGAALAYAAAAAVSGFDTLAVALGLLLALVSLAAPGHRRLFAATFLVSLALELYGTWLGNWRWEPQVPGLALVTTNPPGVAGALYCALDALVALALVRLAPEAHRLRVGKDVLLHAGAQALLLAGPERRVQQVAVVVKENLPRARIGD